MDMEGYPSAHAYDRFGEKTDFGGGVSKGGYYYKDDILTDYQINNNNETIYFNPYRIEIVGTWEIVEAEEIRNFNTIQAPQNPRA